MNVSIEERSRCQKEWDVQGRFISLQGTANSPFSCTDSQWSSTSYYCFHRLEFSSPSHLNAKWNKIRKYNIGRIHWGMRGYIMKWTLRMYMWKKNGLHFHENLAHTQNVCLFGCTVTNSNFFVSGSLAVCVLFIIQCCCFGCLCIDADLMFQVCLLAFFFFVNNSWTYFYT